SRVQTPATCSASCLLAARKPWSTVATWNRPGRAAEASASKAMLSGPPDTARPSCAPPSCPSGQTRDRSAAKRAVSRTEALSIALHLLVARLILAGQTPAGQSGIGIPELGQRDAGTARIPAGDHGFRQEQQAVTRTGALLVGLVIAQEP